jgi:hypothetical protein
MENLLNLGIIEKNESLGKIFTELQLNILKKRLKHKSLNSNEKTYYYKFIKPKIKSMMSFFNIDEINIKGKETIIKERIPKALNIIRKLEIKHRHKKIILSGSFLFNKSFNDIDVFIFTKYDKEEYTKRKVHVTFLPESALDSIFFASLSQISISNFSYTIKNSFDLKLVDVMQTYELLVNSIINKEDYERQLRDFILQTGYISNGTILNPKQLYAMKEKLLKKDMNILSNTFINSLILCDRNIKEKLKEQITDYKKLKKEYKNSKNLNIYIDTYSKVIELAS